MHWIIDGYNVILTSERLSKFFHRDMQAAREELASQILRSRVSRDRIELVFDGRSSGTSEKVTGNFQIVFSSPPHSADDVIKRTIGSAPNRRVICAVSNDLSIIGFAKECGARTMKSEDFLEMIQRPASAGKTTRETGGEKPAPTGKADPELLRLFREEKK